MGFLSGLILACFGWTGTGAAVESSCDCVRKLYLNICEGGYGVMNYGTGQDNDQGLGPGKY